MFQRSLLFTIGIGQGSLWLLLFCIFHTRTFQVGKGGIVRDRKVHEEVLNKIIDGIIDYGYVPLGTAIESPIKGTKGNTEFLAAFRRI